MQPAGRGMRLTRLVTCAHIKSVRSTSRRLLGAAEVPASGDSRTPLSLAVSLARKGLGRWEGAVHVSSGFVTRLVGCLVAALVLGAAAGADAAGELGLITGGERGTYFQFGLDLQRLVKPSGIELTRLPCPAAPWTTSTPSTSAGDADGHRPVRRPGLRGACPARPRVFSHREEDQAGLPALQRGSPLLASARGSSSFDDLAGSPCGHRAGGQRHVPHRRPPLQGVGGRAEGDGAIDTDEALAELKAGRIDAMFYVAGDPVKLFTDGVSADRPACVRSDHQQEHRPVLPVADVPADTYPGQAPASRRSPSRRLYLVSSSTSGSATATWWAGWPRPSPASGLAGPERPPEVEGREPRRAAPVGAVRCVEPTSFGAAPVARLPPPPSRRAPTR